MANPSIPPASGKPADALNGLIPFKLIALPIEQFESLLALSDSELNECGARRMIADAKPGFPCRVSLVDAEPGEEVLLIQFTHHDVPSPYRAAGPIFLRVQGRTATLEPNEIPSMVRSRLLSVRAYDSAAMMVAADVVSGEQLEKSISRFFADDSIEYLHVHNAGPGCYSCRVERAAPLTGSSEVARRETE